MRFRDLDTYFHGMSQTDALDAVSKLPLEQIKLALREHARISLNRGPLDFRLADIFVFELLRRLARAGRCQYTDEELIEDGKRFSSSTEWKRASASKYKAAYRRHLTVVVFPRPERIEAARFREIREHYDALIDAADAAPELTRRIKALGLRSFAGMDSAQIQLWLAKNSRRVQVVLAPVYPQFTPKYPAPDATLEDML